MQLSNPLQSKAQTESRFSGTTIASKGNSLHSGIQTEVVYGLWVSVSLCFLAVSVTESGVQRLLIILSSLCLALLALPPIRLRPTSPAPADPPGADDTYGDEASELCSDNVKPTLDNLDYFDWTYC